MKNSQKMQFKTMTLNVLFDTRRQNQKPRFLEKYHIKHSEERFTYIVEKINQIKPDVITFNEVTPLFIQFLDQSDFISKNYLKSPTDFNPLTGYDVEGNLILIKKKFRQIKFKKIEIKSHDQPVPIVYFKLNKKIIAVASVHLLAFSKNQQKRQTQLHEIVDYFHNESQIHPNVILLQGDMNFHSEKQNSMLEKLNLKDLWLQKYDLDQNPGFTFDSYQNKMINELYWGFQQRRMRLDRIFLLESQQILKTNVKSINLVLNQPISNKVQNKGYMGIFKGISSFIGDIFGKNWLRTKESYLFPSDHFGILATLEIQ